MHENAEGHTKPYGVDPNFCNQILGARSASGWQAVERVGLAKTGFGLFSSLA
jgi:hypothetical protein